MPKPTSQSSEGLPSQRGRRKRKGSLGKNQHNAKGAGAAVPEKFGRPSLLTTKLIADVIGYLRLGSYVETAAAAAGITKETFYTWLKEAAQLKRLRDEASTTGKGFKVNAREMMLMDFSDGIEKAMAEADLMDLSNIRKASVTNWQASAWRLERRHPKLWGRRYIVEPSEERQSIPAPVGESAEDRPKPVIDVGVMSDAKLAQLERLLTEEVESDEKKEENENREPEKTEAASKA